MAKTKVKTKFNGLVWVHEKYIESLKRGERLMIEHQGKFMTIRPSWLETNVPKKSEVGFRDQYGAHRGKLYYLYGLKFVPDEDQNSAKRSLRKGDIVSQCEKCLSVKVSHPRGRMSWQGSIVDFPTLPKEICSKCQKNV